LEQTINLERIQAPINPVFFFTMEKIMMNCKEIVNGRRKALFADIFLN
jgi:hypothetical protein